MPLNDVIFFYVILLLLLMRSISALDMKLKKKQFALLKSILTPPPSYVRRKRLCLQGPVVLMCVPMSRVNIGVFISLRTNSKRISMNFWIAAHHNQQMNWLHFERSCTGGNKEQDTTENSNQRQTGAAA